MKTKNACILLLAALTMTACKYDDSALWEQVNQNTERIAALEAWQAETNTNIQSLQTLLNTADYITAVTPVTENEVEVGYTITFLNSDPITIYHGQKGDKGDTGATGDTDTSAPVPQLKTGASLTVTQDSEGAAIVDDAIYLSVDGGETWTRVSGEDGEDGKDGKDGENGTNGDSFFQSVDTSDPTCVIFTLAGGTTFSVPRYTGIKVDFGDTPSLLMTFGETQTVNFTAEGSDQFTTDNLFTVAPDGWKAEVTLPTRAATEFILTVTAPADATSGAAEGEILVMLDNGQGSTTIGRLTVGIKYTIDGTKLTARGLEAGKLAEAIGNRTDLTSVTVTGGTLNKADWEAIKQSNGKLQTIDLEGATYEGDDKDKWVYKIDYSTTDNILMDNILKTVKLPQGITALGEIAFYGCTALTTVTLPETLTSIGEYAFDKCTALTSIDLPEGVTSIGEYAFQGCTSLTSITLPEELTTIGSSTFKDCDALTSITLPDGLDSIRNNAFHNCTSLTSIDLPEGLTSIGDYAFQRCTSLATITLPDGLESIGDYAFQGCTSLISIDLPETLTSIGEYAFSNCNALTSIDLPEGQTSIGSYAFYSCTALESINLPDKVTSIGDSAFQNCNALTTVTCQATTSPTVGSMAFSGCDVKTIYVPDGSVDDYKAATGWSKYSTKIQAISEKPQ